MNLYVKKYPCWLSRVEDEIIVLNNLCDCDEFLVSSAHAGDGFWISKINTYWYIIYMIFHSLTCPLFTSGNFKLLDLIVSSRWCDDLLHRETIDKCTRYMSNALNNWKISSYLFISVVSTSSTSERVAHLCRQYEHTWTGIIRLPGVMAVPGNSAREHSIWNTLWCTEIQGSNVATYFVLY